MDLRNPVVVVINLGTDLTYALLDPRVRYE